MFSENNFIKLLSNIKRNFISRRWYLVSFLLYCLQHDSCWHVYWVLAKSWSIQKTWSHGSPHKPVLIQYFKHGESSSGRLLDVGKWGEFTPPHTHRTIVWSKGGKPHPNNDLDVISKVQSLSRARGRSEKSIPRWDRRRRKKEGGDEEKEEGGKEQN